MFVSTQYVYGVYIIRIFKLRLVGVSGRERKEEIKGRTTSSVNRSRRYNSQFQCIGGLFRGRLKPGVDILVHEGACLDGEGHGEMMCCVNQLAVQCKYRDG